MKIFSLILVSLVFTQTASARSVFPSITISYESKDGEQYISQIREQINPIFAFLSQDESFDPLIERLEVLQKSTAFKTAVRHLARSLDGCIEKSVVEESVLIGLDINDRLNQLRVNLYNVGFTDSGRPSVRIQKGVTFPLSTRLAHPEQKILSTLQQYAIKDKAQCQQSLGGQNTALDERTARSPRVSTRPDSSASCYDRHETQTESCTGMGSCSEYGYNFFTGKYEYSYGMHSDCRGERTREITIRECTTEEGNHTSHTDDGYWSSCRI